MASYDIIESYNAADETINFGSRLNDGKNLYEASTVAVIKSSKEDIDTFPHIHSLINNGRLYLSIDKTFQVFDDLQCSSIIYKEEFDSQIDTACFSCCKLFLLICCRNGQIILFDVINLCVIITSELEENLWFNEEYFINAFNEEIDDESDNDSVIFLIINKKGKIVRMTVNLNPDKVVFLNIFNLDKPINIAGKIDNRILLHGESTYIIDTEFPEADLICNDLNLKKIYELECNFFLALTNEGTLLSICLNTKNIFQQKSDVHCEDFSLIHVDDIEKQLYVICKTEEQNFIQGLTFPDFTEIFSLPASNQMHLVDVNSRDDDLVYLSKVQNELRIYTISPTLPQKRLERLLRRELFKEAEAFAKEYDLDFETILIAKASLYTDKNYCNTEDVDAFLAIMDDIQDLKFKLHCCLEITCEKFYDVRRVYSYGSTIDISKHKFEEDDESRIEMLQNDLMEKMYRFDTYETLNDQETNEFDLSSWSDFSSGDLIRILCSKLKHQNIEDAIIIYNRLDISYISRLKESDIQSILETVDKFTLKTIEPFLYTFVPHTLSFLPSTLSLFTAWFVERLYAMESSDYGNFPENGIDFLNKMVKLLKINQISSKESFNAEITKIRHLFEALKTIQTLKNNYLVFIPLIESLKGPQLLIRALLTLEIKNFDVFLIFLSTFMLENNLEPDKIYLDEIIDLLYYDEQYWMPIAISLWKCINSLDKKINALLIMLRKAQVPWCDTIRDLAHSALELKHPMVEKVQVAIQEEPINIVLRRPAYNLPEYKIQDVQADVRHFARTRIIRCSEPTVIEDSYMLCVSPEQRNRININLMNHFILRGSLQDAYSFLNRNTPEEVFNYLYVITKICIYNIINNNGANDINNILYVILQKGILGTNDLTEKEYYEDMLQDVKSMCFINKTFVTQITYDELIHKKSKMLALELILEEIVQDLQEGKICHWEVIRLCEKLSFAFRTGSLLLKISEKTNDCKLINECAKYLYKNSSNVDELCTLAVYIVRGESSEMGPMNFDDTFAIEDSSTSSPSNMNGDVSTDVYILKDNLNLAKKIVAKSINTSKDLGAVNIFDWVSSSCNFMDESQEDGIHTFNNKHIYVDKHVSLSITSIDAVREIFNTFVQYIGQFNNPDVKYLTYFNKDSPCLSAEAFSKKLSERLPYLIKNVTSEGYCVSAYSVLLTLKDSMLSGNYNDGVNTLINKVMNQCTMLLMGKVLKCETIDQNLAFSLLITYEYEKSAKLLSRGLSLYINALEKLQSIAQLGIRLCKYHKVRDTNYETCQNILLLLKWWRKIDNCKIPYQEFFLPKKDELMKKLIRHNHMDIKLIDDFCMDFNLDSAVYYILQLKYTMINWKPKYKITNLCGKRIIVLENDEDQLFESCMKIINLIKNKESILPSVNSLWETVNFYHYEVFICILKIVSTLTHVDTMSKKVLLIFLKTYIRFSKPSPNEAGEWFDNYPDSQNIDPLSEWRLPLTPTLNSKDIWNIIRPEVNLKTYQLWIESCNIFDGFLTKDDICCYASKEVVSSGILKKSESGEWVLHSEHKDLFEEIDKCLGNVENPEFNTSAAYYIATCTAPGADQVHALKLAYKYAKLYRDANAGNQETLKAYNKIKKKYISSSIMHILHTNGLAEDKYMELAGNPSQLIEALYFDERIIMKYNSVVLDCPDVNKAAMELGTLYGVNVKDTQIGFLIKWLSDSEDNFNLDQTMMVPNGNQCSENDSDAYLKRAVYLCSGNDSSYWQGYLLNIGLSDRSSLVKARALKCFCTISTEEHLVSSLDLEYNVCQNLIDKLFLVHNLKNLGIVMEVETLDKFRTKCLNKLSRNIQNSQTVKTMASICTTYEMYDVRYWELIFKYAIKFKLFDDLKIYIHFLRDKYYFKTFYIAAWQIIIDQLFMNPIDPKEDVLEVFVDHLRYIQTCPVIYNINFEGIFDKTIEKGCLQLSAWMLQYLAGDKRKTCVDILKKKIKCSKQFMDSVKELASFGLWGTNKVIYICDTTY